MYKTYFYSKRNSGMLQRLALLSKFPGFVLVFILFSCTQRLSPQAGKAQAENPAPDYSRLENWAAHPSKYDPSDSIPKPLRQETINQEVDVFFLHPTTYTGSKDTLSDNALLTNQELNEKTDLRPILYQASIFNGSARIYAPRYRQAHLRMYYIPDTGRALKAFDTAYADIRNAFLHYLNNENQGRPIIIASHSQGTTHAKQLLREFFDTDSTLRKRLVVAYILGIAVEKSRFTHLRPCTDSLSTGCYISWRTYRESYDGPYVDRKDTTVSVINPYSWTSAPETLPATLHKGAVLYKFNKIIPHTQSTRVEGNALWVSRPKFPGGIFYRTKNYHVGDFNLFYMNIRDDVARRIRYYQGQHPR